MIFKFLANAIDDCLHNSNKLIILLKEPSDSFWQFSQVIENDR